MFDKTIQNAEKTGISEGEQAGEKLAQFGEAQAEKVIKIGFDWADTHKIKLSFAGSGSVTLELVPKEPK